MRYVLFELGNLTIYSYGFCIAVGILFGMAVAKIASKINGADYSIMTDTMIWGLLLGLLGSKILYWITILPDIIKNPKIMITTFGSGFVVYGGIATAYFVARWYLKKRNVNAMQVIDAAVPGVAFTQGCGRIGCFMAGCCYGKPTDSWIGVSFKNSPICTDPTPRIPTQLISSAFDICLSMFLLFMLTKKKKHGTITYLYALLYAIGRFIIEFFRDDPRGSVWFLSTSQIIALVIIIVCVIAMIQNKHKG